MVANLPKATLAFQLGWLSFTPQEQTRCSFVKDAENGGRRIARRPSASRRDNSHHRPPPERGMAAEWPISLRVLL